MTNPFYNFTDNSIERLKLRFSDYVGMYPGFLQEYIDRTDGTESLFLEEEITVFQDLLYLFEHGYNEDSHRDYHVMELNDEYKSFEKQIQSFIINVSYSNMFQNATERKIEFLDAKKVELGIGSDKGYMSFHKDEIAATETKNPNAANLNMKMLCLYYLDKHKHISLNKIHPDKKHLSAILSFLIDNSQNTINQKLSKFTPEKIIEIKETKGVLNKVFELFEPLKDMFPELINEIKQDLKNVKL